MIPTNRAEVDARYSKVEREGDAIGRLIGVRRLRPSQQTRIEELTPLLDGTITVKTDKGEAVEIPRRVQMMVTASVCEIDGEPIPFPRTREELDATLDMLDLEGIAAAYGAFARLTAPSDAPNGTVDAAKNCRGTPLSGRCSTSPRMVSRGKSHGHSSPMNSSASASSSGRWTAGNSTGKA